MEKVITDREIADLLATVAELLWNGLSPAERRRMVALWEDERRQKAPPVFHPDSREWVAALQNRAELDEGSWFVARNVLSSLNWARRGVAGEGSARNLAAERSDELTQQFRTFLLSMGELAMECPRQSDLKTGVPT